MVARGNGATTSTATRRRRGLPRLLSAGWALLLLALSAAPRSCSAKGLRAADQGSAAASLVSTVQMAPPLNEPLMFPEGLFLFLVWGIFS